MTDVWQPEAGQLRDQRVLILAQMPDFDSSFMKGEPAPVFDVEEAVTSLVRAVLSHGGTVDLIGDESLALLATIVAGEYAQPLVAEGKRESSPFISVVTTRSGTDEHDPFARLMTIGQATFERTEHPVDLMRSRAEIAIAMVCIGTGSSTEVTIFRESARPFAPIFVIESTGGGAAEMAASGMEGVEVIDRSVDEFAPLRRREIHFEANGLVAFEPVLVPMSLIAQVIVERLISIAKR